MNSIVNILCFKVKYDPRPEFNESNKVAELPTNGSNLQSPIQG